MERTWSRKCQQVKQANETWRWRRCRKGEKRRKSRVGRPVGSDDFRKHITISVTEYCVACATNRLRWKWHAMNSKATITSDTMRNEKATTCPTKLPSADPVSSAGAAGAVNVWALVYIWVMGLQPAVPLLQSTSGVPWLGSCTSVLLTWPRHSLLHVAVMIISYFVPGTRPRSYVRGLLKSECSLYSFPNEIFILLRSGVCTRTWVGVCARACARVGTRGRCKDK